MLFAALVSLALAADAGKPHAHTGKVAPYTNPPVVALTPAESTTLAQGQPVLKQVKSATGGRGVAVFDVKAPKDKVWGVVTNYSMYPKWVDGVSKCGPYKREGNNVYVDFVLSTMGLDVQYYIKHVINPTAGLITWTLDYTRSSDLDDSVGYWRVTPVTTTPPLTRVEYSASIAISGWVPGFVKTMIEDKGLQNATSWVKTQSEK